MSKTIGQDSTPAVPCALNRHSSHVLTPETFDTLSYHECQREFQYWAISIRDASSATLFDISPNERLTCPLLWCRTVSKDSASILHHVSSCPWLSDAWYWCPMCCRPERFTPTKAISTATSHADDSVKEKGFAGAVNFFQGLGCQRDGPSRAISISDLTFSEKYPHSKAYTRNRGDEMVDTSYDGTNSAELDTGETLGLRDEGLFSSTAFSTSKHNQYPSSTSSPSSWQNENHAASPLYSRAYVAPESVSTGVNAQPGSSHHAIGMSAWRDQVLIDPVSRTRNSPVLYEKHLGGVSAEFPQHKALKAYQSALQSPPHFLEKLRIGDTLASGSSPGSSSPLPKHDSEEYRFQPKLATTQSQISELCEAVRAMSEEWIRRLAPSADIMPPCSEIYVHALIEIGFRALRNYFLDTIPMSFQDVFALMHVAGASAYIIDRDDQMYLWGAFLSEVHQWQHLLSDEIEKFTFVKVMSRLCHPQRDTAYSQLPSNPADDTLSSAESAILRHALSSLPSSNVDTALQKKDYEGLGTLTESYTETSLYEKFHKSAIIKACTYFLDNFEYTIIVEDSANRHAEVSWYREQQEDNILTMERQNKYINNRLQEYVGREGFGGRAVDTKVNVGGGLQRTIRELEVTLMSTARSFSGSWEPLPEYLDVVSSLCDEAMQELGEDWRDGFYAKALDTALITSFQLNNRRQYLSASSPDESHNSDIGITIPVGATTPHTVANYKRSRSPHTLISRTLGSSNDVCRCPSPSCQARFKGPYRKANLERHLKTALHHNQHALFKCEICQKPMTRKDNLQQHLRKMHNVDPPMERSSDSSRRESRDIGSL